MINRFFCKHCKKNLLESGNYILLSRYKEFDLVDRDAFCDDKCYFDEMENIEINKLSDEIELESGINKFEEECTKK